MKIYLLGVEDALATLRSSEQGLSAAEVLRRRQEFGTNAVERVRRRPAILRFLRELVHFLAVVLWIAAALCFVADAVDPGQGMRTLGVAIVIVILVNATFSFWQEARAEQVFAALERLLPRSARVMREGVVALVPVAELVPGDVVLLQAGDEVPADARILSASALRVNTAAVTGESQPRARDEKLPLRGEDALHARNVLLAGTSVVSGTARALVTATGPRTELGRIAKLAQAGAAPPSPLVREIERLSHVVAAFAVVLGLGFFAAGWATGLPLRSSLIFGIGIIAANVPEGLLPTVTLALAMAGQRMARRKVVIRHLPAVEALGAATVIVTDKTGTLTEGRMVVRAAALPEEAIGTIESLTSGASGRQLLRCARLCQDTVEGAAGLRIGDPVDLALFESASSAREVDAWPRLDALPFDADRRRMSVVHQTPEGPSAFAKGAPESVLPLCVRAWVEGEPKVLDEQGRARVLAVAEQLASEGLRVLALAGRQLALPIEGGQLEEELTLFGLVGLEDPPRAHVPAAVAAARSAGIRVIMATGDHPSTAAAIARRVGLTTHDHVVLRTGLELSDLTDTQLQLLLDAEELVFARLSAEQKLRLVHALQRKGEVVAVTGDGVNDAPALQAADIGVAMGKSGSDVAREAADIVLVDDDFASIVAAIEEGRAVWDNLRKFITYILTSNVPEIVPYLVFVLFRVPLALTIVQVLAVDLGTDMVPALALGADRPEAGVMKRPPRPRAERLLDRGTLLRAYAWLGPLEAAAAMGVFFVVLGWEGWDGSATAPSPASYAMATTATLGAVVAAQLGNVFACRSDRASVFSRPLLDNRLLLAGLAVELAVFALIAWTPYGNMLFGAAPLPPRVLLLLVPIPFAIVGLEELRKAIVRRTTPAPTG